MEMVQAVGKDQRVTEGPVRFNFRGVDAVVQAVGPALRKHGVVFTPSHVVSVEHERYTTAKGSLMDGVTVIVDYTIHGPAGDTIAVAAAGQAADSGDKAVSKAMSVAYRTAILQALCIPTDEPDPDTTTHERAVSHGPGAIEAVSPLTSLKRRVWQAQQAIGIHDKQTAEEDYTRRYNTPLAGAGEDELGLYLDDLVAEKAAQGEQAPLL